ncbi:MAG: hypothetical protein H7A35_05840 [Planctomycetales bacterium]|nr:hypothetical protein [bacterium]UNM09581.1 MAG: hypothetical protein H7A35_05840 [Planctomycetales bacterium]
MSKKPLAWRIAGLVIVPLLIVSIYLLARAQRPLARPAVASEGISRPGHVVSEVGTDAWCIHQDTDGTYWLGCTASGLYRIDGQEITNYTEADGLAGNNVRGITGDGSGGLLITTSKGLSRFDGQRFSLLEPVDYGDDWSSLKPGPKQIWLILDPARNNPCLFDGDKLISLHLPPTPGLEEFRRRNPNVGYDPAGVYTIHTDRSGNVWFGTASLGACRWDGHEFSWLYEDELVNPPGGGNFGLRSIFEDRDGRFWICNTRQRFVFSADSRGEAGFQQLVYDREPGLPDAATDNADNFSYFASVAQDPDGSLWLACGTDGVWQYAAGQVQKYLIGDGVFAMTVYRDNAARTWVGTGEHGLYWLDGETLRPFSPDSL